MEEIQIPAIDFNRVNELSTAIEMHLKKIEEIMHLLKDARAWLELMKRSREDEYLYELQKLRRSVDMLDGQLKRRGLPGLNKYDQEMEELRDLVNSDEWPVATNPDCICTDNEDEKLCQRAEGILDLTVSEYLQGIRFLDFGCGLGHVVAGAAKRETKLAVGYDIEKQWKFAESPGLFFTTDLQKAIDLGPYDIILLYDVLDHLTTDPIETLNQIKSMLAVCGRVYIRNHPWCSRHGGHLYNDKNKAFLHLAFDEIELERIAGVPSQHIIKLTEPLETYKTWFHKSGLAVKSEIALTHKIEDFFLRKSMVYSRLKKNWPNKPKIENFLEIEFVEYTLEPVGLDQQIL